MADAGLPAPAASEAPAAAPTPAAAPPRAGQDPQEGGAGAGAGGLTVDASVKAATASAIKDDSALREAAAGTGTLAGVAARRRARRRGHLGRRRPVRARSAYKAFAEDGDAPRGYWLQVRRQAQGGVRSPRPPRPPRRRNRNRNPSPSPKVIEEEPRGRGRRRRGRRRRIPGRRGDRTAREGAPQGRPQVRESAERDRRYADRAFCGSSSGFTKLAVDATTTRA